jgi:hypothetical protein
MLLYTYCETQEALFMKQTSQGLKLKGRPTISESKKLKPRFTLALSDIDYNQFIEVRAALGIRKGELARNMIRHTTEQVIRGKTN